MTPFYFGDSARQLFGVYHRAQAATSAPAVVLCSPFGEEAIRAHRFYRILGERLARAGSHVLRFDYFGTGDSAGGDRDVSFSGMCEDINAAHEELLEISGAMRAVWVGLRLGAAAAASAARARPRGLGGLALWDPVLSGSDFLTETAEAHIKYLAGCLNQPAETIIRRIGPPSPQPAEAMGFEISQAMISQVKSIDLLSIERRPARSVLIIAEADADGMTALQSRLEDLGAKVEWRRSAEEVPWNSDHAMNEFLVPAKTLDIVTSAIGAWR